MSIRQPRLLHPDGTERSRLAPLSLRLELSLSPLSTAEMLLAADGPNVAVRDLVELYDPHGSVGVFRVTEVETRPGLTRLIRLVHGLATLMDGVTPVTAFAGPAREAITTLLSHQPNPVWQLGDVAIPEDVTVIFTCGCMNLLSALMQLMDMLPSDLCMDFDQTTQPWTLHLRTLSSEANCVGWLSSRYSALNVVTDSSDLCTRVYPFGAGQGADRLSLAPLTGCDYLDSPAAETWGCIERTFTSVSIFDVPTLKAVAEKYLERHSAPLVCITADAVDLGSAVQASPDSFRLGQLCRIHLAPNGAPLEERVIAIQHPDLIVAPGKVLLTLSNRLQDTADEIAELLREVTASRIIGGHVDEVTSTNRANGSASSPIEHYFQVESWPAVMSCLVTFRPDSGVRVVGIAVDGSEVPSDVYASGSFDALGYLRRDELGVIATGQHTLAIYPSSGAVNSTITLKIIDTI